ncbi:MULTISPECIES: hypothetical protein [Nocardia]|uniref:hypothetical protein n=1 Tax=Nocardia TaxID=1817 RepID=UPI000D69F546|nr:MULTISPECIES: hypothetical protein [Nocardia]
MTETDPATPDGYCTPDFHPTVPGLDWFIEGQRFREVGRTPNANGATIHLAPANTPPPFN